MILKNCTFFNEQFEKEFGDIKIENGKIAEIGIFGQDGKDMSGKIIMPGMIDIHIHGGGGSDFCDATPEALDTISRYLAKRGVTGFCGTTMTLDQSSLKKAVNNANNYKSKYSKLLGVNLEGPYISPSKVGAQNPEFVRAGSAEEFDELYGIYNKIKLITIAPEAFDSKKFIQYVSKKCVVSVGHTSANAEQCKDGIKNGISHATHLFNAMTPMSHREAGVVGTAFDSDITCELICDTHHICPAVLRNAFKILGEDRACVISDSMRGAGVGVGEFELGGQPVFVKEGDTVARLEDGTIAASITNVYDEFKNLISIGIDEKTALKSCTINPAKVIGEDDKVGSIAKGKCADLIAADKSLNIVEVYIDGKLA